MVLNLIKMSSLKGLVIAFFLMLFSVQSLAANCSTSSWPPKLKYGFVSPANQTNHSLSCAVHGGSIIDIGNEKACSTKLNGYISWVDISRATDPQAYLKVYDWFINESSCDIAFEEAAAALADAENIACQAKQGFKFDIKYDNVFGDGAYPDSVEYDGCVFSLSDFDKVGDCGFDVGFVSADYVCRVTYNGSSSTSSPSAPANPYEVLVEALQAPIELNKPAESNFTHTDLPPITVTDTPNAGDTQNTFSQSDDTIYNDSFKSDNGINFADLTVTSGGDKVVTTTTKTTNYADGSKDVEVTTTTVKGDVVKTNTRIDKVNNTSSKSTSVTSGSSNTTVSITNTSVNGDVTNNSSSSSIGGDTAQEQEGGNFNQWTGQGSFDDANSAVLTDIQQAQSALLSKYNLIKDEANSLFDFSSPGSGSLPCPDPVTIFGGASFSLCLTPYENELSIVATVLGFIATFLAIAIILR